MVGAEIEGDVREPVVDGNRHRREYNTRLRSMGRKCFGEHQHESGFLDRGRWWWRQSRRVSGGLTRRRETNRGSGRRGSSREGLRSGGARDKRSGEIFIRSRFFFPKVWLMREEVLEEDRGGAGCFVLRATAEDVVGRAAEHTTVEANGIRALKIRDGVDGKSSRGGGRSWLVAVHCLFSR